jgi:hypothetical protein
MTDAKDNIILIIKKFSKHVKTSGTKAQTFHIMVQVLVFGTFKINIPLANYILFTSL